MKKSATEVMQEALFAGAIDAIVALKAASRGLPNNLLRDLNAIHANTTFADLPAEVQAAIQANVRAALARLLKEGYSVAPVGTQPPPQRHPRPDNPARPQRHPGGGRPGGRPGGPGQRPGGGGNRPGGGRPGGGKPRGRG